MKHIHLLLLVLGLWQSEGQHQDSRFIKTVGRFAYTQRIYHQDSWLQVTETQLKAKNKTKTTKHKS